MNYQRHYDRLIARAQARKLDGYAEVHHVVPRCMGGSDRKDNLVRLTPEEHFLAHQLLCKMNPQVAGLVFALISMTGNPHGKRRNKAYGWIRRRHAQKVSEVSNAMWQDPDYRVRHKAAMDEVRARPGYREQFSAIHKGRIKSEQERANISAARKGMKYRKFSEQARANMSAARKKVWAERKARGEHLEIGQKIRATRIKNGTYNFTPEHKAAIGRAQTGKTLSEEQKRAISQSMKAFRAKERALK